MILLPRFSFFFRVRFEGFGHADEVGRLIQHAIPNLNQIKKVSFNFTKG
jgi:hypothetical protein